MSFISLALSKNSDELCFSTPSMSPLVQLSQYSFHDLLVLLTVSAEQAPMGRRNFRSLLWLFHSVNKPAEPKHQQEWIRSSPGWSVQTLSSFPIRSLLSGDASWPHIKSSEMWFRFAVWCVVTELNCAAQAVSATLLSPSWWDGRYLPSCRGTMLSQIRAATALRFLKPRREASKKERRRGTGDLANLLLLLHYGLSKVRIEMGEQLH